MITIFNMSQGFSSNMKYNRPDSIALNRLIKIYEQSHFNNNVGLLDVNLIIQYVSNPLWNILTNSNHNVSRLYGMKLTTLMHCLHRSSHVIDHLKHSVEKVIRSNCMVENINIDLQRNINNIILRIRFLPLYNCKTGNIIAIEASISVLDSPLLLSEPSKLLKHSVSSAMQSDDLLLTRREHEVLFLQFQCKSAKEISQKLTAIYSQPVSFNTIGRVNGQLYKKFKVYNQEQLLIEARKQRYHCKIPTTLLSDHNIDINDL